MFEIDGHSFKVTRETVHGAEGYTLREWRFGRDLLHDFGMASESEARALAARVASK